MQQISTGNNPTAFLEQEKDRLTEKSSELYSTSIITVDEYERLIEYINKVETKKEISVIDNIIRGCAGSAHEAPEPVYRETSVFKRHDKYEHTAVFSSQTSYLEPINGKGGKFISIFGTNKIIVDNLPPGRTVVKIESIFGMTEIVVSRNIRVTIKADTVFSGVFTPNESYKDPAMPELLIKGEVIFGNLTITRK